MQPRSPAPAPPSRSCSRTRYGRAGVHASPPQAGPAPSSLWFPVSPPRDPPLSLHHPLPRGCRLRTGAPAEESDSRCLPAASWRPGPLPRTPPPPPPATFLVLEEEVNETRGSVSFEPLASFHFSPPRTREHPPSSPLHPNFRGSPCRGDAGVGKGGRQRPWRPHLGCTGVLGRGPCLISRCTPAPHPRTALPPVPHGEIRCSESREQSLPTPIHPPRPTSGSLKAGFCET
ncbi:cyclin-K-like [Bubalus kerabau]|uniref:cyclin-K-like n=1 Tax=Bubalus carabanensis TaxID=3119969 RepID=UPI00244ECA01|nr:cyclin-K-like [Bubalus carabanensis]